MDKDKKASNEYNFKEIESLMKILNEKNLTELSLEAEGFSVVLKGEYDPKKEVAKNNINKTVERQIPVEVKKEEKINHMDIISENIGRYFYRASETAKTNVEKGNEIKIGDDIGYILTLGVKNPVVSEYEGIIEDIFIENGAPVDYGKRLIRLKEKQD
ncbi:acetyl-CoA carboxylase biotin carboxyl carrier protein [Fusobacterium sp. PH5-44]|uniref:acetyl-CoA carboxylase biotin carboxyl carrier protein n=1 Tax=unclassified Fusobacterium TaxID=2648384 RepID=UPI003D1B9BBE